MSTSISGIGKPTKDNNRGQDLSSNTMPTIAEPQSFRRVSVRRRPVDLSTNAMPTGPMAMPPNMQPNAQYVLPSATMPAYPVQQFNHAAGNGQTNPALYLPRGVRMQSEQPSHLANMQGVSQGMANTGSQSSTWTGPPQQQQYMQQYGGMVSSHNPPSGVPFMQQQQMGYGYPTQQPSGYWPQQQSGSQYAAYTADPAASYQAQMAAHQQQQQQYAQQNQMMSQQQPQRSMQQQHSQSGGPHTTMQAPTSLQQGGAVGAAQPVQQQSLQQKKSMRLEIPPASAAQAVRSGTTLVPMPTGRLLFAFNRGQPQPAAPVVDNKKNMAPTIGGLTALMKSDCKVNGDKGDFFDLLGFPDEVIVIFFSFLDPNARMRMRLNKRLHKIEAESKYYLKKVKLMQFGGYSGSPYLESKCATIKGRHYHYDFIRRIAHNTSVGRLKIDFPFDDDLGLKFCNVAKEFKCIGEMSICFMGGGHPIEILTDSFLLDISRNCESVNINHKYMAPVSPMVLHNMYKGMRDGSAIIRSIYISEISADIRNSFLKLLGITYNNGRVISNKNIEAYKDTYCYYYLDQDFDQEVNDYRIHIFDGFSHISFGFCEGEEDYYNDYDEDEDWNSNGPPITIELLKNQEALNSAKNPPPEEGFRRVRMDVYPE